MHTITAAMAWEYFARNRWALLLFPFLGNLMPMLVLGALSSYTVPFGSREFVGIYLAFVLYATVVIGLGVFITQGSINRYYLKPLPTSSIVNFFFWGGAVLTVGQVAASILIWNTLYNTNWPVAVPTLFAFVLWVAFQPLLRVPVKSLNGILVAGAIVALVCYWFLSRHGEVQSINKHFGYTLSGIDLLITILAASTGYSLTLWRVRRDRSGQQTLTFTDRLQGTFDDLLSRVSTLRRPHRSPLSAHRWFDLQTRTFMLPLVCFLFLMVTWIVALATSTYYRDAELGVRIAFSGTHVTATLMFLIPFFIGIVMIQGYAWNSGRKMRGQDQLSMRPTEHRIGHYLSTLPISISSMSQAILQSSLWSILLGAGLIALSLGSLIGWSWLVGIDTKILFSIELNYWQLAVLAVCAFVVFPFALMNNTATFTLVVNQNVLLPVFIVSAIILLALWPVFAGSVLAILLLGLLAYCTFHAVKQKDVKLSSAVVIWTLAIVAAALVIASLPSVRPSHAFLVTTIWAAFSILPFFSMPLALRYHRVN